MLEAAATVGSVSTRMAISDGSVSIATIKELDVIRLLLDK